MTTQTVDKAFSQLLTQRAIGRQLGISANYVAQLRFKIKNGVPIAHETKLALLQKSGWRQEETEYTRKDLVALASMVLTSNANAKSLGAEYLVDKFLAKRK